MKVMKSFLKSDLFLRFLGGFALGAVGVFLLQPNDPPAFTSTALAAPTADHAGL